MFTGSQNAFCFEALPLWTLTKAELVLEYLICTNWHISIKYEVLCLLSIYSCLNFIFL